MARVLSKPPKAVANLAIDPARLAKLSSASDWSESELRAEGFATNPTTLGALQLACRFTDEDAAAACCVSSRTWRRWRTERQPGPDRRPAAGHPRRLRALGRLGGLGSP
ncbi:MAG: hypothetical protein MZV65_49325 [Chromatiales bacterium]|nr:hypothetical protein [Chromatiales bacterium]